MTVNVTPATYVRPDTHPGMDLVALNKHSGSLRSTKQRVCCGRPRNSAHACASAHFNWPDASSVHRIDMERVTWYRLLRPGGL